MLWLSQRKKVAGFTVAEVLMVILLLAAVLGLVVVNYFSFEGAFAKRPVEDQIKRAVAEAHWLARTERETISLSYEDASKTIELKNTLGQSLASFPFPQEADVAVKLFRILPENQFKEDIDFELEEDPVDFIRVSPYGSSAPFVVELDRQQELLVLRFDPFSSVSWEESDVL